MDVHDELRDTMNRAAEGDAKSASEFPDVARRFLDSAKGPGEKGPAFESGEEAAGRRLRAVFSALSTKGLTHEAAVERYEHALYDAWPVEGNDPNVVGSWAWWAKHARLVTV